MDDRFNVKDQYQMLEKMLKQAQEQKAIDLRGSYSIALESIEEDLIANSQFKLNDSGGEWQSKDSPWGWEEFWVESKVVIDPQTKSILSSFWSNERYEIEEERDFETNLVQELKERNIIQKIAEQGIEGSESDIEDETISMQGSLLYVQFKLTNNFNSRDIKSKKW